MKINHLLAEWPIGAVATQIWLNEYGVGPGLAQKYAHSQWLERIGHGAWKRFGEIVTWQGGVYALQQEEPIRFWPGGRTALSLAGFSHYLSFASEALELFGQPGTKMPRWFGEYDWQVSLNFHPTALFDALDNPELQTFQPAYTQFELKISSPERAILELIHQSANEALFSGVMDVLAGMATLSPRRLQKLLEACRSVRVKRVFLLLARDAGHVWYSRLDLSKIDLGKGKRQIIQGGRLDKEFLITVPKEVAYEA